MNALTFGGLDYRSILSGRPEDYLDQAVALDLKTLKRAVTHLNGNVFHCGSEDLAKLFAFRRELEWRMRESGKTRKVKAAHTKKEAA